MGKECLQILLNLNLSEEYMNMKKIDKCLEAPQQKCGILKLDIQFMCVTRRRICSKLRHKIEKLSRVLQVRNTDRRVYQGQAGALLKESSRGEKV